MDCHGRYFDEERIFEFSGRELVLFGEVTPMSVSAFALEFRFAVVFITSFVISFPNLGIQSLQYVAVVLPCH